MYSTILNANSAVFKREVCSVSSHRDKEHPLQGDLDDAAERF